MNISIQSPTPNQAMASLSGEMDAEGCAEIRPALEKLLSEAAGHDLTLDISQVSFLDSSGIGAIVFLFKRLKAKGGNLSLCNVQGQPGELIKLLRVDTAIPVSFVSPKDCSMELEQCAS